MRQSNCRCRTRLVASRTSTCVEGVRVAIHQGRPSQRQKTHQFCALFPLHSTRPTSDPESRVGARGFTDVCDQLRGEIPSHPKKGYSRTGRSILASRSPIVNRWTRRRPGSTSALPTRCRWQVRRGSTCRRRSSTSRSQGSSRKRRQRRATVCRKGHGERHRAFVAASCKKCAVRRSSATGTTSMLCENFVRPRPTHS